MSAAALSHIVLSWWLRGSECWWADHRRRRRPRQACICGLNTQKLSICGPNRPWERGSGLDDGLPGAGDSVPECCCSPTSRFERAGRSPADLRDQSTGGCHLQVSDTSHLQDWDGCDLRSRRD